MESRLVPVDAFSRSIGGRSEITPDVVEKFDESIEFCSKLLSGHRRWPMPSTDSSLPQPGGRAKRLFIQGLEDPRPVLFGGYFWGVKVLKKQVVPGLGVPLPISYFSCLAAVSWRSGG